MTIHRAALLALLCAAGVAQAATVAPIVGTFGFHVGKPGNSNDTVIDCESEQRCQVISTLDYAGKQTTSTDRITKITPGDIATPQGALDYAVEQRNAVITNPEYVDAMNLLRPVLATHPKVSRCWDLNWPTPSYTLLCTFVGDKATLPVVYAFFSLVANCRQAFCGYVIFPLTRRASLSPAVALPPLAAKPVQVPASDPNPYVTAFDKRAATVHSAGKWYFELTVDRQKVAAIYPTDLFFGVSDKEHFTGASENVTPEGDNSKTVRIGIAVDLDIAKLYVRRDGAWTGGYPGSDGGSNLKAGQSYYAALMVAAKSHNQEYIDRGAIVPNYGGGTPMAFPLPQGYLSWRDPPTTQSEQCTQQSKSRTRTLAEGGQKEAQLVLGMQTYYGTCGGRNDHDAGLALMQKSALQGYAPALYALGKAYQFVPRSVEAAKMYEAAARLGSRMAEWELGNLYENGEPSVRDLVASYAWYSLSASRTEGGTQTKSSQDELIVLRSRLSPQELVRAEASKAALLRELGSVPLYRADSN